MSRILGLVVALWALPALAETGDPDFARIVREAAAGYPSEAARLAVGDAFLRFETSGLHADVAARDPALYRDIELRWLELAAAMKTVGAGPEVRARAEALAALLRRAGRHVSASPSSLFLDGLLVILREGFEAILILTALAAYLVKVGQPDKRWLLYAGAATAVAASLVLGAVAGWVIPVSGAAREALEGITMLVAVIVLFVASYWLISKSEARRWQAFVRSRVEGALGSGRRTGLVLIAFVVVFREGFETVLFYQALAGRTAGAPLAVSALATGFAVGVVCLGALTLALFRYGVRIPIRPFFVVTGALLYVLAFKFAGAGVRELQEAGLVSVTPAGIPEIALLRDWLALYPFVEPLLAQGMLLAALVGGALYTVLTGPRRAVAEPEGARS